MKKYLIPLLLLFFPATMSFAQEDSVYLFSYFKNNGKDGLHLAQSIDGFTWKAMFNDSAILTPAAGKDKLMRDPCIIKGGDGMYHMVWTVSWNEKGIGYARSADLVHWMDQRYIPLMEKEAALNCWAPEITYDEGKKVYMIYWATTIPGKFPKTDSSGDGAYNHRMYYTTTKDFTTFSKVKLLYEKGFTVIDATIKKDGKKYIMFLKDETKLPVAQKNIRIATSKKLTGKYSNPSKPITGNYWAEGPTVTKIGGNWIVYFDKYRNHTYGAVSSPDLVNWTDVSDKLKMPSGIRHGTVFRISKNEFEQYFNQGAAFTR